MYVILTSKIGIFRTEIGAGLKPVEAWDYFLFGKLRSRFVIAEIEDAPRITLIEDEPPYVVNHVPSKFLQKFATIAAAQRELQTLIRYQDNDTDVKLELTNLPTAPAAAPVIERVHITFVTNGAKCVAAPVNSNLLRVSLREQGGIPFKCGGGLCGTCKCRIEYGLANTDAIKPKERKHLTPEDFANGYRMACQTFVSGDVSVSWEPRPARPGVE